ncbi:hypothetical protein ZIOFF_029390 [Zingiber officinale]|uniref:Uncharacterized protein n=1 Tax=Zingiber officinale TaxID=94328 RepID=A0A8J5L458_ZINOF|nr:hypothetical protein ZIOFF_029390 [Zingiber officinale]
MEMRKIACATLGAIAVAAAATTALAAEAPAPGPASSASFAIAPAVGAAIGASVLSFFAFCLHKTTPPRVSMPCISTTYARRLSSSFFPVPSAPVPRTVAWFSLQGRLVGAEEATSAAAIGGGLAGREEAVAWELFSPLQRVLLVAVVAAASNRSRRIAQLQRSVQIRVMFNKVLLSMQQKLDDLCEQMTFVPDQAVKNNSRIVVSKLAHDATQFCLVADGFIRQDITEVEKEGIFDINNTTIVEQEERRMSDLSDFNWSVASSVDLQLSTLASEQEFYNLRKECEEKDVMIKELTSATNAIKAADTKRITELEEIIRRKNMVISKLKKDMVVLEKQVVELTRLRRRSSTTLESDSSIHHPLILTLLWKLAKSSEASKSNRSAACQKGNPIAARRRWICSTIFIRYDKQRSQWKNSIEIVTTIEQLMNVSKRGELEEVVSVHIVEDALQIYNLCSYTSPEVTMIVDSATRMYMTSGIDNAMVFLSRL